MAMTGKLVVCLQKTALEYTEKLILEISSRYKLCYSKFNFPKIGLKTDLQHLASLKKPEESVKSMYSLIKQVLDGNNIEYVDVDIKNILHTFLLTFFDVVFRCFRDNGIAPDKYFIEELCRNKLIPFDEFKVII
jgi:hypothetical protein